MPIANTFPNLLYYILGFLICFWIENLAARKSNSRPTKSHILSNIFSNSVPNILDSLIYFLIAFVKHHEDFALCSKPSWLIPINPVGKKKLLRFFAARFLFIRILPIASQGSEEPSEVLQKGRGEVFRRFRPQEIDQKFS